MIRMQKKAAAKAETSADAPASKESASDSPSTTPAVDESTGSESKEGEQKVSLLGIGGKAIGGGAAKAAGKKRTPGEIRIQKGLLFHL